jgi:hypothetical protein
MDNLDLGDQSEDFMICYDDILDKSTDTWKTGLELHEDNQNTVSSCSSKFDNEYQVLAIVGDNSEELDDNNNPVLNPANITRGANHLAEGDTADSTNRSPSVYKASTRRNVGHDVAHEAEAVSPLTGGKFGKLLRCPCATSDSISDIMNIKQGYNDARIARSKYF